MEKLKSSIKENWKYLLTSIILMSITLLITATMFYNHDYSLNIPGRDLFSNVAWSVTIVLGILGIIFLKNIDLKKIKLENVFLCLVIPLGLLYVAVYPFGMVPDEEFHARKATAISQGNFFSHANEEGKATDYLNSKINEIVTRSATSYAEAWKRMSTEETDAKVELEYTTMALYAPICHMPQALAMFITRLFKAPVAVQCYVARIFNLALSISLVYMAIKLIPFKKQIVLFISLLPITLQEFASMSADALTISICLFYISYILYLKFDVNKKDINKKDIAILGISSIVVALCKIVYLPLCLLLFILPKEKFKNYKAKWIPAIIIFLSAILLNLIWLAYCSRFLIVFNPDVNEAEQIKYVLSHPITYLLTLFRSFNMFSQNLLCCLFGEGLSLYTVSSSPLFIFSSMTIFLMLYFINEGRNEIKVDGKTKFIFLLIFAMIFLLIYTSLYVQWSPLKKPLVYGVQARYFLPILMLLAVVLFNNKIVFKGKIENRYIASFMLFFNLHVLTILFFTFLMNTILDFYMT